MRYLQRPIVIVFLLAIVARMIYYYLSGFTFDDAFITFRYVDNIIGGNGFVYNPGERVLGTTTPLFVFILTILSGVGIPILKASLGLSLIFSGLTAVIILRLAQSLGMGRLSYIPVMAYIFFPRLLVTDTAGMETALFGLLNLAAFYFQKRQLTHYAVGSAALAALTRPEGFLTLALILVYNLYKYPRRRGSLIMVAVSISIPWIIFCWLYFGSPIPHSMTAKLALYSRFGHWPPWQTAAFILGLHNPLGIFLLILALLGGFWLWRRKNFGRLEIVWMVIYILGLSLSRTHMFVWYASPLLPIYLFFAGASVMILYENIKLCRHNYETCRWLFMIGIIVILSLWSYFSAQHYRAFQDCMESIHCRIGDYLAAHAHSDDLIAAEDIGYMGYICGRTILDRDGLVSPQTVPYNKQGHYLELVLDYSPDWVMAAPESPTSDFLDKAEFLNLYEKVEDYSCSQGNKYILFKRMQ